jgi:hypothetical protein
VPTIIDSLILQIGLDAKSFTKGQKEATEQFKKTKDGIVKSGGEIEGAAKKATLSIGEIQKAVLELLAVLTAGKGLKDFIADVTRTNAETGRLAKTLDLSVESLSAWEGAAQLVGGSAEGTAGSIQSLVSQFQQFYLTGQSSIIPYMNRLGVSMRDAHGGMRDMGDVMLDLADRFSKLDPARAAAFGHALGFDQGTINLLILGRKEVQKYLDLQKEFGTVTKEQAKNSAELQFSWMGLVLASESLGRTILNTLQPALKFVADKLKDLAVWARQHGPFLEALFVGLAAGAAALSLAIPGVAEFAAITVAVGALAAAFALLYDDWKTWTEGGKSLLGSLWKYFADFNDFVVSEINVVKSLFLGNANDIRNAWKQLFADFGKFFGDDLIGGIKKFSPKILEAFKQAFADAFDWLKGRFNTIWEAAFGHKLFDDTPSAGASGAGAAAGGAPADNRNFWQRHAPKWLGGQDAPGGGGGGPGGAGASTPSGPMSVRGRALMDRLVKEHGWTPAAAAIAAGNAEQESSIHASGETGDGGSAHGLFQWRGDRFTALQAYASANGKDWRDFNTQVDFFAKESEHRVPGWKGVKDLSNAGRIGWDYERYGDNSTGTRVANARGFLRGYQAHPAALNHIAALHAINNSGKSTTNNTSSEVHIGAMHVHSRATDAAGLAKDFKPALKRHLQTNPANYALR